MDSMKVAVTAPTKSLEALLILVALRRGKRDDVMLCKSIRL
jgi:hypothetical protein